MTKASEPRLTLERDGRQVAYLVAQNETVYEGTMVALDASGMAHPAGQNTVTPVMGVAQSTVTGDGHAVVTVRRGCFGFDAVSLTHANLGATLYAFDDQTVSATGTVEAGTFIELEFIGSKPVAWVDLTSSRGATSTKPPVA
ncbi:MAG: hypothetical protein WAS93_07840 [Burkholderiaceae bacterium]